MKKITIIFAIFFAAMFIQSCSWPSNNSNQGSQDFSFQISPSIWKSNDGGKTWETKDQGTGKANIKDANVLSFSINPYDSQNIFVGLKKGGILRSSDGGDTWEFANFQSEKVYGLALDPADGRTLYASAVWKGTGKIFKSEDKGNTWQEIYSSPSSGSIIISLLADKRNHGIIYATTNQNEVLKSVDSGKSWQRIYLANAPVLNVSLDADNSNLLYFITTGGSLFRSSDGGTKIKDITSKTKKIGDSYTGGNFSVLMADPSQSGVLYLAGEGGIIKSSDQGEKWKKVYPLNNPQNFPVDALAVNPQNSQELFYGSGQAVYKSEDSGKSWSSFQFSSGKTIRDIVIDPGNSKVIFATFNK